jgi:outer membrane lipoprotein-sorting protein
MSLLSSRPALRWLVPAAAAVVVIGGGAAIGTFAASAEPSLPPRSAEQLLVDVQTARLEGISGTVVQSADLGLPSLPNLGGGGSGSADVLSLLSGTNTLRVWYSGPDKARVALMGTLGETDAIYNGRDVWLWNSQENKATHHTVSPDDLESWNNPRTLPLTPQEAADRALAAVDPSTKISVGRSAQIAGRDAYELVLEPRDTASLMGQVRIAIDAKEHVPLRFEVYPKDSDKAAFEIAFTQVDFGRPDDEQFRFNPPPGAKVEEGSTTKEEPDASTHADPKLTTVGKGWTTVVVVPGTGEAPSGEEAGVLRMLPEVSGAWGSGNLLSSRLVSVLVTDDGRILAGMVTPERLYEVAASKAGK